jgi:hypothetical protein
MVVYIAFVNGHEDILVTKAGRDRVAASKVSGCPVRAMDGGAERGGVVKCNGRGGAGDGRCSEEGGKGVKAKGFGRGFASGIEALAMGIKMSQRCGEIEGRIVGYEFTGKSREGGQEALSDGIHKS